MYRIAARFMNIKHRQSVPLPDDHPAVVAAFEMGTSAEIFRSVTASLSSEPQRNGNNANAPTGPKSSSNAAQSRLSTSSSNPSTTGIVRFENAEAGPSNSKSSKFRK